MSTLSFVGSLHSQSISKHAIGLRLGDSSAFGTEISYQRALKNNNRLELDLGWRNSNEYEAFKLVGLHQWVYPLDGAFNWYVGAGGGIASFDGKATSKGTNDTGFLIAGDIGIEYGFKIPLQLALDFKPEFGFNDFTDNLEFDIALGIRYQF